ncbi:MAG TPA: HPr family phosphocarrier protein [Candidatus Bathyarchaeota archaeon]|nr:HPr family phosphocarrier protein [Candidatus Bathyarchaeota archaeon]
MVSATVTLLNKVGLHARPAALFVQTAKKFKCEIRVRKGDTEANAKSILDVLSLGAEQGDEITIEAEGEDEEKALKTLVDLVNNKFGEE